MRKRINKLIVRMIVLLSLVIAVGGFLGVLMFGMATEGSEIEQYFSSSLVTSEVLYIISALAVVLVIALAVMVRSVTKTASTFVAFSKLKKANVRLVSEKVRFPVLSTIDNKYESYTAPIYEKERDLKDICEGFRNYAASQLGLYYDIDDIRRFVAGMGVSKLMILQGMSGTGKTSLAYAFGQYIDNDSVVVPVQPMWKERSDMIGYFNEFTKRFNETNLLRKLYEAGYKKEMYVTILDEVNISRIEYYFAEFLSLLELPDEEKRYLDVVSDVWANDPKQFKEGKIKLPANMWFIGTANNDDSTFAISDKVYDRAMVLNLEKKSESFEAPETKKEKISYERWTEIIKEAQKKYCLSAEQEENIQKLDAYLIDRFRISFGNRIVKQIREYVPVYMAAGGKEIDALDDILSKKVLRKLESQSPAYVKNEAQALCETLDSIFGKDSMKQCKAHIDHLVITM